MKHIRVNMTVCCVVIALIAPFCGHGETSPDSNAATSLRIAVSDAYYALDEGSGLVIADASGVYPPGKITGAAWAAGKINTALRFDGKKDFVSLGPLNLSDRDFTLTVWVKPRAVVEQNIRAIISKERAFFETHQFCLYTGHHNRIGFRMSGGAKEESVSLETVEDKLPVDEWTHLAVTRYGPRFVLYQDGRPVADATVNANIRHDNHVDMRIGASYPLSGTGAYRCFNGLIDEVRIREGAMFAAEIAAEIVREKSLAYRKAGAWSPLTVDTRWGDFLVDLTPFCADPGLYEILFEPIAGSDHLEVRSVRGRIGKTERALAQDAANPFLFRIKIDTPAPLARLALTVRGAGNNDTYGEILVRPVP